MNKPNKFLRRKFPFCRNKEIRHEKFLYVNISETHLINDLNIKYERDLTVKVVLLNCLGLFLKDLSIQEFDQKDP